MRFTSLDRLVGFYSHPCGVLNQAYTYMPQANSIAGNKGSDFESENSQNCLTDFELGLYSITLSGLAESEEKSPVSLPARKINARSFKAPNLLRRL